MAFDASSSSIPLQVLTPSGNTRVRGGTGWETQLGTSSTRLLANDGNAADDEVKEKGPQIKNTSLFFISADNPVRRLALAIYESRWFEYIDVLLNMALLVVLAMFAYPTYDTPAAEAQFASDMYIKQYIMVGLFSAFTIRSLWGIFVYGTIRTPDSYLRRNFWNTFEVLISCAFWIQFGLYANGYQEIRIFTAIVAMRPLKLLLVYSGTRNILNALLENMPLLIRVFAFLIFFWLLFAIVGVRLFQGSLRRQCFLDDGIFATAATPARLCGSWTHVNGTLMPPPQNPFFSIVMPTNPVKGYACPVGQICLFGDNPNLGTQSFDNFVTAFLVVFTVATLEGWSLLMYDLMDSENAIAVPFYFIILILIMSFTMINLFIAVIAKTFASSSESTGVGVFGSARNDQQVIDDENGWRVEQGVAIKSTFIRRSLALIRSRAFRAIVVIAVLVNLIVMALRTSNDSAQKTELLNSIETAFTAGFAAEAAFKLLVLGRQLFASRIEVFSLFLAVVTVIIQIPPIPSWVGYGYLTIFQVLRFIRVIAGWSFLSALAMKAFRSFRVIFNVLLFVTSILAIISVVFMQFFGGQFSTVDQVAQDALFEGPFGQYAPRYNYDTFWQAFINTFQIMSVENWVDIMYISMGAQLHQETTWFSYNVVRVIFAGLLFFFTFAVCVYILLNFIVAAILENFELSEEDKVREQYRKYMAALNDSSTATWYSRVISGMRRVLASNPVQSVKPKNVSKQLTAQVRRDFINEFLQEEDGDSSYEIKQASNMSLEDGQGQSSSRDDGRQRDGLFRRMFRKRSRVSAASSDDPSQYKSTTALVDDTATVDEKVTEVRRKESGGAIHAATEEDDFEVTMRDGSTRTFHHYRTLFTPDLCKAYLEGTRNVIDHFLQFNDVTFATPTTTARIETTPSKPVYDRVFFVMTRSNPIRRFCRFIVGSDVVEARDEKEAMRVDLGTEHVEAEQVRRPLFDKIILLFIFASTIVLAIDTPLLRRESDFYANLFYGLDVFFFAIFTLEFLLRVLADGVLFTPKGYFKNIWNVLDFFVLFCMFMDSFIFYYRPNSQGVSRFFRAARAARPLRIINQFTSLQVVFYTLVRGWKDLLRGVALLLFVLFGFSIWSVTLFAGKTGYCNDPLSPNKAACIGEYSVNVGAGEPHPYMVPRVWVKPRYYDFDNVGVALLTLFETASTESWMNVFWDIRDFAGTDLQPERDVNMIAAVFMIPFMLVGYMFFVQLFIGVVVNNFETQQGMALLTNEQQRWRDVQRQLLLLHPSKQPPPPSSSGFRLAVYNLVIRDRDGWFQKFITGIMIAHILVICTEFYEQRQITPWLIYVQEALNILFLLFYLLECVLKVIALGIKQYLRLFWNVYDAVTITGALVCSIITIILLVQNNSSYFLLQIQKLFIVLIVIRLVQKQQQLATLVKTVIKSLRSIGNVFILFLLVITIYAIMGVQLFGLTRFEFYTNERANFRTFMYGVITLFRMTTGEDWHRIMADLTIEGPYCVEDLTDYSMRDCGSPSWSYFLFITFVFLGSYICLNLFIMVIMDNFSYTYSSPDGGLARITYEDKRGFKKAWLLYDKRGTGFIEPSQLMPFLMRLSGAFEMRVIQHVKDERDRDQPLVNFFDDVQYDFDVACHAIYADKLRVSDKIDSLTTESWNNPTLPGYFYYRRVHRRRPVNPYTPPTEQPGLRLEKSEPSSDNSMGLSLRLNVPAVDKKKAIDLLIAVCRRRYAAIDAAKVMKRKEDLNMLYVEGMCLVNKEDKLPFEKVLKMISYRLIDPERFLRVEEQARRRALHDRMLDFVRMERVAATLYGHYLRKRLAGGIQPEQPTLVAAATRLVSRGLQVPRTAETDSSGRLSPQPPAALAARLSGRSSGASDKEDDDNVDDAVAELHNMRRQSWFNGEDAE